ncbi:uncharacterized protein IL334_001909 [Kwoniella shivajii]|uniref:Indole-diterpene biosynthesis protein PaxU n=1 Tax=Kwoniella shivajii TaxID=564305 RepID=A0ABZ1CTF7_9TREE|nr:hypothetical protein IL334_001909 [Kwoniella shivajii]
MADTSLQIAELSTLVSIHKPVVRTRNSDDDPSLIILCTWMDAPSRPVTKYVNRYSELFPSSTILSIKSTAIHLLFTSTSKYDSLLQPALEVILGLSEEEEDRDRICAAVYSNGGSQSITRLAQLYRQYTNKPINIKNLLVDSAPGSNDLSSGHRALYLSLPSSPFRKFPLSVLSSILLWISLIVYMTILNIANNVDPITKLRLPLNDPDIFELGGRRRYIYSKSDPMVSFQAVEESINEAEYKGWKTSFERFEKSGHVAHSVSDPDRYWNAVKEVLTI